MSSPLGQSVRIWATAADCVPVLPPGPSGRSQIIRAREGDCVPDFPPGPSGRSRIIRVPGGITDTFTRTLADGWGWTTGNTLQQWVEASDWSNSVDGTAGILTMTEDSSGGTAELIWTPPTTDPDPALDVLWVLRLSRDLVDSDPISSDWGDYLGIYCGDTATLGPGTAALFFANPYASDRVTVEPTIFLYDWENPGARVTVPNTIDLTEEFRVRFICAGPGEPMDAYVWPSSQTQPETPTLSVALENYANHSVYIELWAGVPYNGDMTLRVESLNVIGSPGWL